MRYTTLVLAAVALTTVSAINKNEDDGGLHKTTESKYDEDGNIIKEDEAELVYEGKSGAAKLGSMSLAAALLFYSQ